MTWKHNKSSDLSLLKRKACCTYIHTWWYIHSCETTGQPNCNGIIAVLQNLLNITQVVGIFLGAARQTVRLKMSYFSLYLDNKESYEELHSLQQNRQEKKQNNNASLLGGTVKRCNQVVHSKPNIHFNLHHFCLIFLLWLFWCTKNTIPRQFLCLQNYHNVVFGDDACKVCALQGNLFACMLYRFTCIVVAEHLEMFK